jgi:hypothetical protein
MLYLVVIHKNLNSVATLNYAALHNIILSNNVSLLISLKGSALITKSSKFKGQIDITCPMVNSLTQEVL